MIMNFIYVFNDEDKQKLLNAGATLLKEDKGNNIFVFQFDGQMQFDQNELSEYMFSDTLTF